MSEDDIKAVERVLARRLKVRGDIIDPCPQTFLLVTCGEMDAARAAFARIVRAARLSTEHMAEAVRRLA